MCWFDMCCDPMLSISVLSEFSWRKLFDIHFLASYISPDQHNGCVRDTYERTLTTFVNAVYTIHSDCMIGIDRFQLEI